MFLFLRKITTNTVDEGKAVNGIYTSENDRSIPSVKIEMKRSKTKLHYGAFQRPELKQSMA